MDQQLRDILLNLRDYYKKKVDKEIDGYKLFQRWQNIIDEHENASPSILTFVRSMSTHDLEITMNEVYECISKKCSCKEEHETIKEINLISIALNSTTKTYQQLFLDNGADDIYLNILNTLSSNVILNMMKDELAERRKRLNA